MIMMTRIMLKIDKQIYPVTLNDIQWLLYGHLCLNCCWRGVSYKMMLH